MLRSLLRSLLVSACFLFAVPAFGAIAYFAQAKVPAVDDDASGPSGPTITITAPGSMVAGHVIVVGLTHHNNIGGHRFSATTTGGQNWHITPVQIATGAGEEMSLAWCIFNGTMVGTDFVFTLAGTGTINSLVCAWLIVESGVSNNWVWDVYPVGIDAVGGVGSSTVIALDYSTISANTLAIYTAGSRDNNTWTTDNTFVTAAGSGNIYQRNGSGVGHSIVMAVKAIAAAGAVGATTYTQATLGPDGGSGWYGALRPSTAARKGPM